MGLKRQAAPAYNPLPVAQLSTFSGSVVSQLGFSVLS